MPDMKPWHIGPRNAVASGTRTISVVVPGVIGGEGVKTWSDSAGALDLVNRGIVVVPEKTARWRLRAANRSATRESYGTPGSGTYNLTGCWMGTPLATGARWNGTFLAAPEQVIGPGSFSGETEWVSEWVTDADQQLGPRPVALSVGMTAPTSTYRFYDDRACCFTGVGAAAAAGAQGAPAGAAQQAFSTLDFRVEYEVSTDWPLVLCLGDSITSGYSATPSIYQHESWPARAALENRFHAINAGVSSMQSDYFNSVETWGWERLNLGAQVPDAAIVLLGTNDLGFGSSAATIASRLQGLTFVLQYLVGVHRWTFGTVIPGEMTGGVETQRQALNDGLRSGWLGGTGLIDFDRVMRASYGSASSTADRMDPADVHPKSAGYAAMATAVKL